MTVSGQEGYGEDTDLLLTGVTDFCRFFAFLLKIQGLRQEHLSGLVLVSWLPMDKGEWSSGWVPSVYMYYQSQSL